MKSLIEFVMHREQQLSTAIMNESASHPLSVSLDLPSFVATGSATHDIALAFSSNSFGSK
jgi:hypothetical protein